MSSDATQLHVGKRLYQAGWRQGAILRSAPFKRAYNNDLVEDSESATIKQRKLKDQESLVIITQDCDILSKSEPHVEAFVCSQKPPDFCARIVEGNSSRFFLVNRDDHLVAEATKRLIIKKELLEPFEPDSWPSDDNHLDRFARWLARRYIRPAYPQVFVEAVHDPIRETVEDVPEGIIANFSTIVHEVRISKSSIQGPPFDVGVTLLTLRDEITEEQANAIDHVTGEIQARLEPDHRITGIELRTRTPDEMSVSEYFATHPIYLENYTDEGDEYTRGAEPLPQA